MDWLNILNQCLDILLPAIASVISVIFGVIATKIKATYDSKVQDETVKIVIENVVKWAQQVYIDCDGSEKLQAALDKASLLLNEKGITISNEELDMLIESAVYGLKHGVTTDNTNSDTTEQGAK